MIGALLTPRTLMAVCVAGSGFWLPGCGANEEKLAPLIDVPLPPVPIAGCEDEIYEYCDIRKAKCQSQVYSLVACLREVPSSDPPPIRVITEDEYRAEQALNWDEAEVAAPNHFENALVLLGLVDSGTYSKESQIDQRAAHVGAYYSGETLTITVIDHGGSVDGFDAVPLLAHEFVHAQQDQELNLKALWEAYVSTNDQSLALLSLVEGEATLYSTLVAASLGSVDLRRLDLQATFEARAELRTTWLLEQPSPYAVRGYAFPYGTGALYAYLGWREFNPEGLRARFADPPLSSQRLMASREMLTPELGMPLPDEAPTSEALGTFVTEDVLGALGVRLFLRGEHLADADEVALAWRSDRMWATRPRQATGSSGSWSLRISLRHPTLRASQGSG